MLVLFLLDLLDRGPEDVGGPLVGFSAASSISSQLRWSLVSACTTHSPATS